jgi:hypothetical protein
MSNKFLKQIKKDFNTYDSFTHFETQRLLYSKELRRFSLEAIAYYSLKVNPLYGEKTFWPEEIPNNYRSQYKLNSILAGASTRGGDIFAISKNTGRLNAIEIKSRDLTAKKKNLSHSKLSPKEVALNNTKIGKNDRIVITDYDDTSYLLDKDMANWASIHISEVFNDETFAQVRDYVLNDVLPEFVPYNFRTDKADGTFHKKQLTKVFTKMVAQKKKWGHSKGLLIKPTATGKGVDPVLLVRKFFISQWGTKKPVIITVSPSLNVLTGNVLKQMKDQSGSGVDMKAVVWASDLTPSDDPKDLALLRTQVDVAKGESNFQDLVDNASKGIWIHTTIHSYRNMEIALKAMRITRVNLKFIDEVKHTVQDWDSDFAVCVKEKYVKSDHTLGLDANIIDGKEDGVSYKTSMRNKKLWREIYEEMSEEQAVKLGWKRKTKLIVAPWQDHLLPQKLYDSLYDNKNGEVRIKGSGVTIPFTWLASICSIIEYRIKHTDRHHTMVTTNKIEWSRKYEKAFRAILPLYLKNIKVTKGNGSVLRRLKKLFVKSIYNFGSSSKLIQREVDEVPNNHKDSVIIQVRLLGEGWDPKGAWLDSWSFADPTSSKIRIYQTGGRSARIGDDIFKATMFESHCVVPLIVQSDLTKEIAINKAFKQLRLVAKSMQIGTETIEDSVDFLPWQNMNIAGQSTRTKGSMNKSVLVDMGIDEMQGSFSNFYKHGQRYSGWTILVDDLCDEMIKNFYQMKKFGNLARMNFYKGFLGDKRYQNFYKTCSPKSLKNGLLAQILKGQFWMLSEEKKIEAKTQWRHFNKVTLPGILYKKYFDAYETAKNILSSIDQRDLYQSQVNGYQRLPKDQRTLGRRLCTNTTRLPKVDSINELSDQMKELVLTYEDRVKNKIEDIYNAYAELTKNTLNPEQVNGQGDRNKILSKKFKISPNIIGKILRNMKKIEIKKLNKEVISDMKKLILKLLEQGVNIAIKKKQFMSKPVLNHVYRELDKKKIVFDRKPIADIFKSKSCKEIYEKLYRINWSKGKKRGKAWNSGLTKENNSSLMKNSIANKKIKGKGFKQKHWKKDKKTGEMVLKTIVFGKPVRARKGYSWNRGKTGVQDYSKRKTRHWILDQKTGKMKQRRAK